VRLLFVSSYPVKAQESKNIPRLGFLSPLEIEEQLYFSKLEKRPHTIISLLPYGIDQPSAWLKLSRAG
jgi:hypothetical protein